MLGQVLNDKAVSNSQKTILTSNYFAAHALEIGKILQRAVNHAVLTHKRLGNSIATWKDEKVVIIPPEEIFVEESEEQSEES